MFVRRILDNHRFSALNEKNSAAVVSGKYFTPLKILMVEELSLHADRIHST